jgi:hypothetical protein
MRRRRDRPRLIGEIVFRHPARCEAASPESITPAGHGKIAWREPRKKTWSMGCCGLESGDAVRRSRVRKLNDSAAQPFRPVTGGLAMRRNEPGARVDVVHPMTAIHAVLRGGRAVASEEWRGSNGPVSAYLTSISAMCDLSSGEV